MATDALGNTISLGDSYLVAGVVVSIHGDTVAVNTLGLPITVAGSRLAKVADLAGGSGVTDHGALSGLTDVADHPGYLLTTGGRALAGDQEPDADGTRSLGAALVRFLAVYSKTISAGSGTLSLVGSAVDIGGVKLTSVADPTALTDGVNLQYLSGVLSAYAVLSHGHTLADVSDSGALAALSEVAESSVAAALLAKINAGTAAFAGFPDFILGATGWGATGVGSPTSYTSNPRFSSSEQNDFTAGVLKIDGQSTNSGTQARIVYSFQRVWLATGRAFRFSIRMKNESGALAARWGLHSDDNTSPNASGRPAGGVWIEWDPTVSTSLYLCVCDGATVTAVACSTLTISDLTSDHQTIWIVFEGTSSVKLYKDEAGVQTLEATATTNIPSDSTSRACRGFIQLEKDPANTTRPDAAFEAPSWTTDHVTAGTTAP